MSKRKSAPEVAKPTDEIKVEPVSIILIDFNQFCMLNPFDNEMTKCGFKVFVGKKDLMPLEEWESRLKEYVNRCNKEEDKHE